MQPQTKRLLGYAGGGAALAASLVATALVFTYSAGHASSDPSPTAIPSSSAYSSQPSSTTNALVTNPIATQTPSVTNPGAPPWDTTEPPSPGPYSTVTLPTILSTQPWPADLPDRKKLVQYEQQVTEVYYSVGAHDTVQSRLSQFTSSKSGITAYLPSDWAARLAASMPLRGTYFDELQATGPVVIPSGQPVPDVDIRPLTIRATTDPSSIVPTLLDTNQIKLDATVKMDVLKKDGSLLMTFYVSSATSWQYQNGQWQLNGFLGV